MYQMLLENIFVRKDFLNRKENKLQKIKTFGGTHANDLSS